MITRERRAAWFITALFTLGTIITIQAAQPPVVQTDPAEPPDHTEQTLDNGIEPGADETTNKNELSETPETAEAPKSYIVEYESEAAREKFIAENNITETEIVPTNLDNTIIVTRPVTATEGTTVSANQPYRALLTPDDARFDEQWHHTNIKSTAGWNTDTGDSTLTVAVIDTGFALSNASFPGSSHEDMDGKWFVNPGESGDGKETNDINDDLNVVNGESFVDDWRGWDFARLDPNDCIGTLKARDNDPAAGSAAHGTIVSSLIGAATNNAIGVAGIDWDVKILPLQGLHDSGFGCPTDIAEAIDYAVDIGVDVINLSLGGSAANVMETAITNAVASGVTVVAAAGNDGCDCILFPAAYSNVIAVGATDEGDNITFFSSFGSELYVVAPGQDIVAAASSSSNKTDLYTTTADGTSFSSPIVAGLASLLKAVVSDITPAETRNVLRYSADTVSGMGGAERTDFYGHGRVNMQKALKLATATHPDGTLVQDDGDPKVYLLENSQRRHVKNLTVFNSHGFDFGRVKTATIQDMRLGTASTLDFREGTVVKGSGDAIYVIDYEAGTIRKRHITTLSVFTGLGYSSGDITTVSDSALPATDGPDITDTSIHPDGTLVKGSSGDAIYWLEDGQKRHVLNTRSFLSHAFDAGDIKTATSGDLALADGDGLNLREGSIVRGDSPPIYAIDYEAGTIRKRHITTLLIYKLLEYSSGEEFKVGDSQLPAADGPDIN